MALSVFKQGGRDSRGRWEIRPRASCAWPERLLLSLKGKRAAHLLSLGWGPPIPGPVFSQREQSVPVPGSPVEAPLCGRNLAAAGVGGWSGRHL